MRYDLLLACLAFVSPLAAQDGSSLGRAVQYAEAAAQEHLREEGVPGLALALVTHDSIVAVITLGVADLATRAPVTDTTRFQAGSLSKAFTAVVLLQLQEEGLLELRRPLETYLPWFGVRSSRAPITLHHLLTHTAGLPRDRSDLPSSPYTAVALRDRELGALPGTRFAYSNIGYQLLSLVIEEVEGRPFADAVSARVLEPLRLRHTRPAVTQEGRLTSATGYQYLHDDRPPLPGAPIVPVGWAENSAGDANVVSTVRDLATFLRMLLAQGQHDRGRLLQPASFARMVQRTVPAAELGAGMFYGYGLVLGDLDGDPILWHSGGMPGFRTMLAGDLDEGLGVVVLMNGPGNPRRLGEYALRTLIAARRGREPPPVPVALPPDLVRDAATYAARFEDGAGGVVTIEARGDSLFLEADGQGAPLFRAGPETFVTAHPGFTLFPLRVRRDGGAPVELMHGGRWWATASYRGERTFEVPGAWQNYVGHYRAQLPYYSNFRVVLRKGSLLLVSPEGLEEPLVPVGGAEFRVGREENAVERVRFADIVSGRALRMNLSGTDYYRTTTH